MPNQEEVDKLIAEAFRRRSDFEKEQQVERYRRLNRFVKPGQIVFAGSSLMEQFPIAEMQLGLDLPLYIYNRGIGGFTTSELFPVLDVCVYDLKPKYLFLNIGTNDLNATDLVMDDLMERYAKILDGTTKNVPGVKIYLLAYYPVNQEVTKIRDPQAQAAFACRTNERIGEANREVEKLAVRYGARYLDVSDGLKDENGNLKAEYTVEGVHFYADGYAAVLERLLPVLKTLR